MIAQAKVSPSRDLAFRILLEVEKGGFAADLLAERSQRLDSRDAGLASAITLGVLRFREQLDYVIQLLAGKPASKLDGEVRAALRLGIFQLRNMDRIPSHAAVSESVELVKQNGKRSASGLVNAILRKAGSVEANWPNRATALSCPEWLVARWESAFGKVAAEVIAAQALDVPRRYLHVSSGTHAPEGTLPTDVAGCFELPPGIDPPPGYRQQDIGSQHVGGLLDASPDHMVLDLCAAPGNKTAQLRESGAWTIAADVSRQRLQEVAEPRLVLDARNPLPFPALFDRILVDAPCSGTGTIAHNPEIKWRLAEVDLARHASRQRAILRNALAVLKPGGLLVYSTCSLEPEENERVVESVAPERVIRTVRRLPGREPGDGFFAALLH